MSIVSRVKDALTRKKAPTPSDRRVRIKATKSIGMFVAGQTYLIDPSSAFTARMLGWAEILDHIPGVTGSAEVN